MKLHAYRADAAILEVPGENRLDVRGDLASARIQDAKPPGVGQLARRERDAEGDRDAVAGRAVAMDFDALRVVRARRREYLRAGSQAKQP